MKIQIQIPIPIQIQSMCSPELERNLLWKSLLASSPFSGQSIATCIYCYVLLYFYLVLIVLLYFHYILGARHCNLHWSIFLCFWCKIFFNPPSAPEMEISAQLINHCDHCMGLQQKFTWGSKCLPGAPAAPLWGEKSLDADHKQILSSSSSHWHSIPPSKLRSLERLRPDPDA